jgi:SpoVK/Ycf46/Vps4 family AAA+-type ATPase
MLADAKRRMVARSKAAGVDSENYQLEAVDFVGEQDAIAADPLTLLDDLEAVGDFKNKLERLGQQIKLFRQEGAPTDSLVTNYIFTGEPGTGKTTVARKMGAILHAFGVLVRADVVTTTGEGMTGEYVGQTKKNVEEKMRKAQGGVLFVDEVRSLLFMNAYSCIFQHYARVL